MTVIFSLIAGVFLGVLMHICGMFTYLIFQEVFEAKPELEKDIDEGNH
jgi:hypothetical protein